MPSCRKRLRRLAVLGKIGQDLLHLSHHFVLIGNRHFVPHSGMNDISWTAEVCNHRYGTRRESFKHCACAVVA